MRRLSMLVLLLAAAGCAEGPSRQQIGQTLLIGTGVVLAAVTGGAIYNLSGPEPLIQFQENEHRR
ncbi:hypothetical protein [Teichococcus wenyumeiae]|uniref:hypothetical protein n=1 Tax=Teichococcus wenyumeiae TaxID=2478470 RepID=UPI0011C37691|nr:hypothetical protein [Pseudoroseomonas wenyumeiae]